MPRLTTQYVRTAKEGRHSAGPGGYGLAIVVRTAKCGITTRRWQQRLVIDGKRTWRSIGYFPETSAQDAKEEAVRRWLALRDGGNLAPVRSKAPTFKTVSEEKMSMDAPSWKPATLKGYRDPMHKHVYPKIGGKRIDSLTTRDLQAVFLPLNGTEIGKKARQWTRTVFDYAVGQGYRNDNPAGEALIAILPRTVTETKHHPALPYSEVGGALERLRNAQSKWIGTRLCLEFVALTACRHGEARAMRWSDVEGHVWHKIADQTKTRKAHRVPLSKRALEVLAEAKALDSDHVFPSKHLAMLNKTAVNDIWKAVAPGTTIHGLRSSFRDWAAETGVDDRVAEICLAHVEGSKTVQAYFRTDLLEQRRVVMQAWADYLAGS